MRRIGSAAAVLALLVAAGPALAATEFYQSVDRAEVGTEDTFALTVVVSNAPDGAELRLPRGDGFEVLSKSQSTQMSYSFGSGGGSMQRMQKHTLVLRANQPGTLTIPPSVLKSDDGTLQTDALTVKVVAGNVQPDPPPRRGGMGRPPPGNAQGAPQQPGNLPDPFAGLLQGLAGMDDLQRQLQEQLAQQQEELEAEDAAIPRGDSDLFIRASLSRDDVYVGEQINYTLHIYSRLDLSSVDAVIMPKLEGFWSEDLDTPTQLSSDTKTVNGVPYRVFLLRRRALFPVTAGTLTIEPASADITTGFLFQGRRVQRKSQELTLKVKPLPAGAPAGMAPGNVGQWRLTAQAAEGQVELGQPITVRLVLEGRGNLKNVGVPPLVGPAELKIYEPTLTDTPAGKGKMGGRRVLEYLVLPQNTGTFTLPSVAFPYFDPESQRYEVSRTPPLTFTVVPGAGGPAPAAGAPTAGLPPDPGPRNVLSAGGLRPLRVAAALVPPSPPLHGARWYAWALAAPLALLALVLAGAAWSNRSRDVDAGTLRKQQARAARKRLAAAERLVSGKAETFYAEVERALLAFLESRLGEPVQGLTRGPLEQKLRAAGAKDALVAAVAQVLDTCEMGRFAPGAVSGSREKLLDQAEAAMEGWS
ncbi:MAG: protein BatD [Deltaproteobacteria bacterium]|nr:protein BatD [Deltaproteobacteria bacterium]